MTKTSRTVWRSPPNRGFGLSEGSGRWGVACNCDCHQIFNAVTSLIRANRHEMALTLLETEIGDET